MKLLSLLTMVVAVTSREILHNCIHDKMKHNPPLVESAQAAKPMLTEEERRLQTTWRPIRISGDFSLASSSSQYTVQVKYIQGIILPQVASLISSLFQVTGKTTFGSVSISSCSDKATPSSYNGLTVDADLLLFADVEVNNSESYIAYASTCMVASDNKRPIVGYIMFNLAYITATLAKVDYNTRIAFHEIMHVMGFSSSLYDSFPNFPNGQAYTKTSNSLYCMKTTQLISTAQNYFNCPSVSCINLENNGGSGSASSHWEKSHWGSELMTAVVSAEPIIGPPTLSFFADMGWYAVATGSAEQLYWGQGEGCAFLSSGACTSGAFLEFCAGKANAIDCNADFQGFSQCSSSTFLDGCYFYDYFDNGICNQYLVAGASLSATLETKGPGSRCLPGVRNGVQRAGCFKVSCSGGVISITTSAGTATCSTANQSITLPDSSASVSITCPDPTLFCNLLAANACPTDCGARGRCRYNGVCRCKFPYTAGSSGQCSYMNPTCPYTDSTLCQIYGGQANPTHAPLAPLALLSAILLLLIK